MLAFGQHAPCHALALWGAHPTRRGTSTGPLLLRRMAPFYAGIDTCLKIITIISCMYDRPAKPEDADAGAPPVRKRIRITDATTESVAEILASTWRGLLLCRDELSGWLGSMDRYNGGGDRPFWLEAFGGRSYTVDRKGRPEPIIVEHMSVSVLGGTQPDKLDTMLVKADDDGLAARFLTVFLSPVPLLRPTEALDEEFAINAFKRLHGLQPAVDDHGALRPIFCPFRRRRTASTAGLSGPMPGLGNGSLGPDEKPYW